MTSKSRALGLGLVPVACLFFATAMGHAQTTYSDGGIHNISTTMPVGTVSVSNHTTLDLLAGGGVNGGSGSFTQVIGVSAYENCTMNMNGGSVVGGTVYGGQAIGLADTGGTVNINGGSIAGGTGNEGNTIGIFVGSDTVNIYGGTISGGTTTQGQAGGIDALPGSTVNIYGGTIVGGTTNSGDGFGVVAQNGSTVNIHGGTVMGAASISGSGSQAEAILGAPGGTVNIYGGTITGAGTVTGSGVTVYGICPEGGTVNIYGTGFNYALGPISALTGTVTGTLADGTPFNEVFLQNAAAEIVLFAAPEPSSLILLALGGLLVLRRSRPIH